MKAMASFCIQNVKVGGAKEVVDILERDYKDRVEVRVLDCFKRCLECKKQPFCKMKLETIQADDAQGLVEKIISKVGGYNP